MDELERRALSPSEPEVSELALSNNLKTANELLGGGHRSALDIGCGAGKFTRGLTSQFKQVAGIDVKARAIDAARAAAAEEGVRVDFRVGSAEALPWPSESFELVVFSNSLHHMPDPAVALREAARVLERGGLLYVMEPVAAGSYFRATRLVNDEREVRTNAYRALLDVTRSDFVRQACVMYRNRRAFSSFQEWKSDQIDRDEKRLANFDAQPEAVRSAFEDAASHEDGQLTFTQVFRIDVWKKV